jgi:hypothetical protein
VFELSMSLSNDVRVHKLWGPFDATAVLNLPQLLAPALIW